MMKKYVLFGLTLCFFFHGAHLATIKFTNNCPYTVWPATLTGGGSPQLPNTGFELPPKSTKPFDVPPPFSGRFWGRTQCSANPTSGTFTCATGDCGSGQVSCNGADGIPPVSLLEFTLAPSNGQDFYDISLVDGFNLMISVSPLGGSGINCTTSRCAENVNSVCPPELAVKGPDGRNNVIACKSACEAFAQPQYCCTGEFGSPDTCKPTNYSLIFKNQCPQASSYACDDTSSTFSCTGGVGARFSS